MSWHLSHTGNDLYDAQPSFRARLTRCGLAPDGHNRNDGLFWAACRAAEAGDEAVLAELAIAARATGLAGHEIAATIRSARRTAGRGFEQQGGREAAS